MKKSDRNHPLFHASQQEVAQFMDVDRTTIRAWTKGGMPYKAGGRGATGEYDAGIVFYWWASLIHRNKYTLPKMSPCRQLAVARAFVDRNDDQKEERLSRSEFPECFRKMVAGHFQKNEIEQAIAYAEGIFDITFHGDR